MKASEVIEVDAAGRSWTVAVASGRKHPALVLAPHDDDHRRFWKAIQSTERARYKETDHWIATFTFSTPAGQAERTGEVWFNSGSANLDSETAAAFARAQGSLPALNLKITLLRRTDASAAAYAEQQAQAERQRLARVAKFTATAGTAMPARPPAAVAPAAPDSPIPFAMLDDVLRAMRTEFDRDIRAPADNRRRGTFGIGWREAVAGHDYGEKALVELTWQNLGYRLGQKLGELPDPAIETAFEYCAAHFAPPVPPIAREADVPEEVEDDALDVDPAAAIEGAAKTVMQTRYERSPHNRAACLSYHGHACACCGVDFGKSFPCVAAAQGFIHVHHLRPLALVGGAHGIDPVADLVPLCPNCHAVAHMGRPAPYSLEELRRLRCSE